MARRTVLVNAMGWRVYQSTCADTCHCPNFYPYRARKGATSVPYYWLLRFPDMLAERGNPYTYDDPLGRQELDLSDVLCELPVEVDRVPSRKRSTGKQAVGTEWLLDRIRTAALSAKLPARDLPATAHGLAPTVRIPVRLFLGPKEMLSKAPLPLPGDNGAP